MFAVALNRHKHDNAEQFGARYQKVSCAIQGLNSTEQYTSFGLY